MSLPLVALIETNTFRQWFNLTNDIVAAINGNVLADGQVSNGNFTANGSILVKNTWKANSSLVLHSGNTTIAANTTVSQNCNTWNFAAGALIIQPINGTTVNSIMTVNAALFINATSTITGDTLQTGNVIINGTLTSNAGPLSVRQVLLASANAIVTPAHLAGPQNDDYGPAGLNEASIVNLFADVDTVLTGIAAPSNIGATGGRVLYLQNVGTTYKVTIVSANTSSGANNRFKTENDAPLDILPGGSVCLLYTTSTVQWRPIAPPFTTLPSLSISGDLTVGGKITSSGNNAFGNTSFAGWINVANQIVVAGNAAITGNTTITGFANVASTLQVTGVSTLTGNVTMSGYANISSTLQVAGLSTLTGNTTFTGFANVGTTLEVAANATFKGSQINVATGNAHVGNALVVDGLSTLTGNTTISGFVNVAGLSTLTGNVTMSGFANIASTLQVTGVSTLNANAVANGARLNANCQVRCDFGTAGRLVLPVGASLWAT